MLETQNLRMKVIDVTAFYKTIADTEVALSPSSSITWANFSDEGQIYTFDSIGVMRQFSFSMGMNWIPVLDTEMKYKIEASKFYVIGVSQSDISCVVLNNKTSPDFTDKNKIKVYKFLLPLLDLDPSFNVESKQNNPADSEEIYLREYLEFSHEKWRRAQWSHLRNTRNQSDPSYFLSQSIYTDQNTLEKQRKLDKTLINSIRLAALNQNKAKILTLSKRLYLTKSISLCITLLDEMKLAFIADQLRGMLAQRQNDEQEAKEKRLSDTQKPIERESFMSMNEKMAKNQAIETGAKPSQSNEVLSIAERIKNSKPVAKPVEKAQAATFNPFAKKENSNTINKTKNFFTDLINKSKVIDEPPVTKGTKRTLK